MQNRYKRILFLFISCMFVSSASGQINSPFTRFGFGEIRPQTFTTQQSMGGMGAAFRHRAYINPTNPASYSSFYREVQLIDTVSGDTLTNIIKAASFETSILARIQNTTDGIDIANSGDGNIGHMAFGIPIPGFGGLSFGLIPYSEVNYNVSTEEITDPIGKTGYNFAGNGGLYHLYSGLGYGKKNLSVGAQMKYLFGTLSNSNVIHYPELANSHGTRKLVYSKIRGFVWEAGLQYTQDLSENFNLHMGVSGAPGAKIKAISDTVWDRVYTIDNQTFGHIDTISSTFDATFNTTIPANFRAGMILERKNKWLVGLEFRFEQWSKVKDFLTQNDQQDSWQLMLGGQFIPDIRKKGLANKRYRFGAYLGESYLIVNNEPVQDYGITFGFGIPVIRPRQLVFSSVDLSFNAGSRGKISQNLINDNYFQINFGINLNDSGWIFKTKFY